MPLISGNKKFIDKKKCLVVKNILGVIVLGLGYLFIVDNYVAAKICLVRNSFGVISILYVVGCVVLYAGEYVCRYMEKFKKRKYLEILLFFIVPMLSFFICEIIYNPLWHGIAVRKIVLNYALLLMFEFVLLCFCRRRRTGYIIMLLVLWVYGIVNYYVLEFKGNPLLPSDLISYKTAMDVVGNYSFYLADTIVSGTLLLIWSIAGVCILCEKKGKCFSRKYIGNVLVGAMGVIVGGVILVNVDLAEKFDIYLNFWSPETTYFENGGTLAFLLEIQSMQVSKPNGYSQEAVQDVLESYGQETATEKEIMPSVIVIMNESFADLKVIGEFESDEYLENWNSMEDYIMKGNLYTSVHGGGTCNSEFEFLTGHSMVNFTSMVYPYQMFNLTGVSNMTSILDEQGYKTVAIHPATRNNWNRERVYQQLGFQNFISMEDMENIQHIRNYASDAYDYEVVKEEFEKSEGPIFIFNVTIQNHSGYEEKVSTEILESVEMEDQYKKYEDVSTYLTLIKESDRAFAELLDYFSNVDEPVIVCLFGDHQPTINADFIQEIRETDSQTIEGKVSLYCTPYVIWSNYEMEEKGITKDMSLNYLGANVLDVAGLHTPYSTFLLDMQEEMPVINTIGNCTVEGEWQKNYESNKWIGLYRNLQYYMLFDEK